MSKKLLVTFLTIGFIIPSAALFAMEGGRMEEKEMRKEVKEMIKNTRSEEKALAQNIDIACVGKAIDVRETSLMTAFDAFSVSAKAALTVRKDALVKAWAITDAKERRTARNTAYEVYQSSMRKSHEAIKLARKNAWATFNVEVKKCGSAVASYGEIRSFDLPTSL